MDYSHVGNSPLETILYINIRRFPSFRDVTIVQNFTCDWSGVVRMPHVSNVCICLRERAHRVNLKSYFINARRRPFHKWAFHLQCRVINCYLMDGAHALTALSTVRVRSLSMRLSREARCDTSERAITARFHRWALDPACGKEKSLFSSVCPRQHLRVSRFSDFSPEKN